MRLRRRKVSDASSAGYSIIDDRLAIRGELDTAGTIRVEGRVEGALHRAGSLIVGARGELVGDVEAVDLVVAGTIRGNVHVSGRLEIEPGASVHGELRAKTMILREGANVNGRISVGEETSPDGTLAPRLELAAASGARARG